MWFLTSPNIHPMAIFDLKIKDFPLENINKALAYKGQPTNRLASKKSP